MLGFVVQFFQNTDKCLARKKMSGVIYFLTSSERKIVVQSVRLNAFLFWSVWSYLL